MTETEILKKVRRIEIKTRRVVDTLLGGDYRSSFRGKGMEFHDVREYMVGDDVRTIDWRVTARMNHPYVKRFVEERELNIMLLIDLSGSSFFGSKAIKRHIMAEIGAILAFSAIRNNDRVGLLLFTDMVEKYIPLEKGRRHGLRIIRDILFFDPKGRRTDPLPSFEFILHTVRRRGIVFLISDFMGEGFNPNRIKKTFSVLSRKHDLIPIVVRDPLETKFPIGGVITMVDLEDQGIVGVLPRELEKLGSDYDRIRNMFKDAGIDWIEIFTGQDYTPPLHRFFRMRARRRR